MSVELFDAIRRQDFATVKSLIAKDVDANVNEPNTGERHTPLAIAAEIGCVRIAEYLLTVGQANPDMTSVHSGDTPLHIAARRGDVAMLQLILNRHADVNRVNARVQTPLYVALKSYQYYCVALLINHAEGTSVDASILTHEGESPISLLCYRMQKAIIASGGTAAGGTVTDQQMALFKKVASCRGADLNIVCPTTGDTPLTFACRYGVTPLVEYLLSNPSTDLNKPNRFGDTPLHVCAASMSLHNIKLLLGTMATSDSSRQPLNINAMQTMDAKRGGTPLHTLLSTKALNYVDAMIEGRLDETQKRRETNRRACVQAFLEAGADYKAYNNAGYAAIHLACLKIDIQMLQVLLNFDRSVVEKAEREAAEAEAAAVTTRGRRKTAKPAARPKSDAYVDMPCRKHKRYNPLMLALESGISSLIYFLVLEGNADVNARLGYSNSVLTLTFELFPKWHVCQLLLTCGADVNFKVNKTGMTPLTIAIESGFDHLIEPLADCGAELEVQFPDGEPFPRQFYKGDPKHRRVCLPGFTTDDNDEGLK